MDTNKVVDDINLAYPRELNFPKEIIMIQPENPTPLPPKKSTKLLRKHRFFLVGIALSLIVLISSVSWVSIQLVRNKGTEDSSSHNPSNTGWTSNEEDANDWHSAPDHDQPCKDNRDVEEGPLFDEEILYRDDILMDDQIITDYLVSSNNVSRSEGTKRDLDLSLFFCPPPGDPLTIDLADIIAFNNVPKYHRILLGNSPKGILCMLLEVSTGTESRGDRDLQLKPIGRSYNGRGWEPYHELYSAMNTVPLSCSDSVTNDCVIVLPPLAVGRKYILKSYEYSLGPRDRAARFLETTTFGATSTELDAFVASGDDPSAWLQKQLNLPITSHRQFFRERANNFHAETTWMGKLSSEPCRSGARYRRFVFVPKDNLRTLTIAPSPIDTNSKVLMVGGKIRSVIPGRVKIFKSETNKPVVSDGSYEICSMAAKTFIGSFIGIKVDSECYGALFDGIHGNPVIKLDEQHHGLAERLVAIDGLALPVMQDFFGGGAQMLQLFSDVPRDRCNSQEETTGAPEMITIASTGDEFWIHTPSFALEENRLEAPLYDGGKSAVEATSDAPEDRMKTVCANVPRTFLNEDYCVLSTNACSPRDGVSTISGARTVVCGSPYEVANSQDPHTGSLEFGSFDLLTQYNRTFPQNSLERQKETVWLEIALKGDDQLRQRMAWALSQIIVVSPNAIQQNFQTESFLTFYDIFVRNAFGNYFDILKEVTYSPMMAEMLTYNNGVSTGFAWTRLQKLHHADENYARELLQLFSLGLYGLNDDGTIQLNDDGHESRTYKNHDISEYAKVFVGFANRAKRGNVEDVTLIKYDRNEIDPLQIIAEKKDHFPKLGMNQRYVGDGYPLCKDVPARNFLKKGAVFRLLGSNPNPELLNDPDNWWGSDPVRISLDKSSLLSNLLCNEGYDGRCSPMMKVVLDSDIECYGVECSIEELRTFEVGEGLGIWYEYIRPPCVNHAFYDGAKTIRRRLGEAGHAMCGETRTLAAAAVCCDDTDMKDTSRRQEMFSGERLSFNFAQNRCSSSAKNQKLCGDPFVRDIDCKENGGCDNFGTFYWSSSPCSLKVKINREGKVAVIHDPQIESVDTYKMVSNDSKMFFRVDWILDDTDSFIPDAIDDCVAFGCISGDDETCICPITIQEVPAFADESLLSIENVLSTATIGSFQHPVENLEPINGVSGLSKFPNGDLGPETVFKVFDSNGQIHFRKNVKSEVHVGSGDAKFRNPVTFYSLSEPTIRDAAYEIDAALGHAFFHKNIAPFLALRLAQRFGNSNPSPRYIRSISMAFRRGMYIDSSTGMRFGSSQYGCLKATIAAVLLDEETQNPILDADPTYGSLHEPYLKIVKVLRSLGYKAKRNYPLLTIGADLQALIGQQSHKLPNVFSFFKPEYQPSGRVNSAGMRSPESQVLSGPTSVQTMNTIISYLKYGVASCYGGFGNVHSRHCMIESTNSTGGMSSYDPETNGLVKANDIIDDLATLLTSGRLDKYKREVIKEVFEDTIARGKSSREAIINAQQLVVASPEFHATNLAFATGQSRPLPMLPAPTSIPYKAIIFVMLPGGYDSFNMLVPKTCDVKNSEGKSVSEQYLEQRGPVGFDETSGEFDLIIDATHSNQPCSHFAIHDELTIVKELYDSNDLAFFANAGVINNQGLTKYNYHKLTRSQLFAHNAMQREVVRVDPYDKVVGTGIMGRAKDVLRKHGHVVNTISIDNPSIAVDGMSGDSPPTTIIGRRGSQEFAMRPEEEYDFDIEKHTRALNGGADEFSGIFGETWSQQLITGIDEAKVYKSLLDHATLDETVWTKNGKPNFTDKGKLGQEHWEKWSTISKLIQKKDLRNTDRDFFFTELGSWDHHDEMKDGLRTQLHALNFGLELFVKEAKASGFWDDVAVVIASDFGRTFTPNSNDGTDHGWGGHYMILGGDVDGGKILGEYPSDLTPAGHLVDDRGRFLPTTSWDSIWNGVLEWTGVTEEADLDYCLPNRQRTTNPVPDAGERFPLLTVSSIFGSEKEDPTGGRNLRRRKD